MEQPDTATDNHSLLRQFIEVEAEALLGTLRYYVIRAGLVDGQGATLAAVELLNDVTVEALAHAGRFRPAGQPRAWLLGIAANLVRRRQAEWATRNRREPLVGDLYPNDRAAMSEDELFDLLAEASPTDPTRDLEANEAISAMLARVSGDDQRVLRLAVLHNLNGQELARALGITPGTARVRLHRALNRLRQAWPGPQVE